MSGFFCARRLLPTSPERERRDTRRSRSGLAGGAQKNFRKQASPRGARALAPLPERPHDNRAGVARLNRCFVPPGVTPDTGGAQGKPNVRLPVRLGEENRNSQNQRTCFRRLSRAEKPSPLPATNHFSSGRKPSNQIGHGARFARPCCHHTFGRRGVSSRKRAIFRSLGRAALTVCAVSPRLVV